MLMSTVSSESDLIAHWTFNDDVIDQTGNGYNGTYINPGSWNYNVDSKEGTKSTESQFSFSNAIEVGKITFPTTFSIAFWHKWTNSTNTIAMNMFSNGRNTSDGGFAIWLNTYNTTDGRILVYTWDTTPTQDFCGSVTLAYNSGAWNHIGVTYNSGTWAFIINGIDVTSSSSTQTDFTRSGNETVIGNAPNYSGGCQGKYDDFRIYSTTKSLAEMQSIRNEYL